MELTYEKIVEIGLNRDQIAWRAAQDIADGDYVNLGIGIPDRVANFVSEEKSVCYHTENGVMGFGPKPPEGEEDPDLISAGKHHISIKPGCSFFHHADSFAMMRGGHIDRCFLGAMQVAYNGDIANWTTNDPNAIPAVGGAMDLVAGVENIGVLTEHITRTGDAKLVSKCTYPLTGLGVVSRIYTNLAILDTSSEGFIVREMVAGITLDQLKQLTDAPLIIPDTGILTINVPDI